jgi:hypothetical protein
MLQWWHFIDRDKKQLMKKLIYILSILSILLPSVCFGQTDAAELDDEKQDSAGVAFRIPTRAGNYLVGANLLFARVEFQKGLEANYNIGLSPKIGFFVLPNIAAGLSLDLGIEGHKGYRSITYGASPFARFYFARDHAGYVRPLQFFVEAGVGFGGTNSRYESGGIITEVTTNGVRVYVLPGIDYFLNNRVAVEAGLQYLFIGGKPDAHILGLSLGFQTFLGR